jgi:hypothetical protein
MHIMKKMCEDLHNVSIIFDQQTFHHALHNWP